MPTYAIGDLQGCFSELEQLLEQIRFSRKRDKLIFAGDLVNRGPQSLECLRFDRSLGKAADSVLGNHDLHLLAVAHGVRKPHRKDTLEEIVNASDADELLEWLRRRPLLIRHKASSCTVIHAGLPDCWSLSRARRYAKETEKVLQGRGFHRFIRNMYDDQPDYWKDQLKGDERHRFIINCLTRMRYCHADGRLELKQKDAPGTQPKALIPWYAIPTRKTRKHDIVFGHWSTVTLGKQNHFAAYRVYPLDTGCLWGGKLTALRLEDRQHFSVPSRQPAFTA